MHCVSSVQVSRFSADFLNTVVAIDAKFIDCVTAHAAKAAAADLVLVLEQIADTNQDRERGRLYRSAAEQIAVDASCDTRVEVLVGALKKALVVFAAAGGIMIAFDEVWRDDTVFGPQTIRVLRLRLSARMPAGTAA
jgi:hypothetical protein